MTTPEQQTPGQPVSALDTTVTCPECLGHVTVHADIVTEPRRARGRLELAVGIENLRVGPHACLPEVEG